MPTTYYYCMEGMMIGESTNGVMRNYITDAIGSVVGTVLNGVAENTYQYKPYGAVLAKTGTAADPSFLWNGKSGYRATGLSNAEYYALDRTFSSTTCAWTTLNPNWPSASGWSYAGQSPVGFVDPSSKPCILFWDKLKTKFSTICSASCNWCHYCSFSLCGDFRFTLGTNGSTACKNCNLYQWIKEDGGPWEKDDACGWPIHETSSGNCKGVGGCTATSCHFHDKNCDSGFYLFECHTKTHIWEFITCVCCAKDYMCIYRKETLGMRECQYLNCNPDALGFVGNFCANGP